MAEGGLLNALQRLRDGIAVVDRAGAPTFANDAALALLDGTDVRDGKLGDAVRSALTTGERTAIEMRHATNGTWLAVDVHPSADGATIVVRDISAEHREDHLLAERSQLLAAVSAASPDLLLVKDTKMRIRWANDAYVRALGFSSLSEIEGRLDVDVWPSPLRGRVHEANERALLGETTRDPHVEVTLPGQRTRTFDLYRVPLRDNDGCIVGIIGYARDITARAEAESEARASDNRFRELLASLPAVVWTGPAEGDRLDYVSAAATEALGLRRDELLSRAAWEALVVADDLLAFRVGRAELLDDQSVLHRFRIRRPDGEIRWLEERAVVVDGPGHVPTAVGLVADITEHRDMEDRLAQTARLETVGRLASGLAHDVNNLLFIAAANAQLLAQRIGGDAAESANDITTALEHAAELVRQLLDFARRRPVEPRLVDPNAVIDEFWPLLERLCGDRVRLERRLAPGLPAVLADPSQLRQVLTNLTVNARDAMPTGGEIVVSTDVTQRGDRRVVTISVTDTGVGMTDDVLQRAFEPFFTTKPAGQGTGLGLASVLGIVQASDGRIEIESEPGRGTSIRVVWPAVA